MSNTLCHSSFFVRPERLLSVFKWSQCSPLWSEEEEQATERKCLCSVAQSRPTLCEPMDCSLPGSSVHGDSPSKNTGVGCHALLQRIFPTQGSNSGLLHCRQILYWLSHQGSAWTKPNSILLIAVPFVTLDWYCGDKHGAVYTSKGNGELRPLQAQDPLTLCGVFGLGHTYPRYQLVHFRGNMLSELSSPSPDMGPFYIIYRGSAELLELLDLINSHSILNPFF